MTLKFSSMSLNDIDSVHVLLQLQLSDKADRLSQLKEFLKSPELCWLAKDDSEIIAVLLAARSASRGDIHRLVVHPSYRRRGIASKLVGTVLCEFRSIEPIDMVFVRVACEDFGTTSAFFLKQGFRLSSRPDGEGIIDALTINV